MKTFQLNKLIRDKVFESMQTLGQQVVQRQLDDTAFSKALQQKLIEEANEFDPTDPKALDELADLLEVIETASLQLGTSFEDLRVHQLVRRSDNGGFEQRVHVDTVTLKDDDPWAAYYEAHPERFKQL